MCHLNHRLNVVALLIDHAMGGRRESGESARTLSS
jgi:hypothetical protein